MSRVCSKCQKGKMKGNLVSHSKIKTNRHYDANLQKKTVIKDGVKTSEYICTKCLKTAKKAPTKK